MNTYQKVKQLAPQPTLLGFTDKYIPNDLIWECLTYLVEWVDDGMRQGLLVNGKREGVWKRWYENGQLCCQGTYVNGEEEGKWKAWHENGQLRDQGTYVNGEREGEWKRWYEDGQLWYQEFYVNGKREGEWKWWFNGRSMTPQIYLNGIEQ